MDADLFRTPGHLINRLSKLSLRWADERFQRIGLAAAQMPVLYALKDGATSTQTELARMAHIEQPTMAQLLGRMERDGLIKRAANPEDKRSSLVSLTPLAVKKLPAAREVLREGNKLALEGFTEREIETLTKLLLRLLKNVEPMAEQSEVDRLR
ncbi:MarR family winged helix-turn-helix transcriptional regulator [Tunturiibacter gelidoferens]|uniref:DNA-binding MarR family transcriptional regulator n=1 Tax=Tunturiibacter gelidiferens TaxID=3069689 RepID=A0A9X0QB22_9BACT|nr:MarR family transcriptional regulator [Edaphobacter lichenicola]MBB5326968.1 DNA-binding MarR family transcriptional regulator [Edaphobacter lichenicola]